MRASFPLRKARGVEFVRTDMPDTPPIPAHVIYHAEKERRTRLQRGGTGVDTVEHFLAACTGAQLDNITVELSGAELPGLDGSALEFLRLFRNAGAVDQASEVRYFRVEEPVYVRDGDATLVALPTDSSHLTLQYVASFDEPGVEGGSYQFELTPENFESQIAPARTFCMASEVEALRAAGFGKGANRDNTVVLGDPETELRMPDEPRAPQVARLGR